MAKNVEHLSPKSLKPNLKSPSRSSEKVPKKHISFNLEPDFESREDTVKASVQHSESHASSSANSPAKKRKMDIKIPNDIDELEEEIEKQLDSKAEKTNLSVVNVKNILRSVITNKYVVDMVRQTVEEGGVTDVPFAPKLTRAKTKELLQHPQSALPPVVGFLTPIKDDAVEISPEIKLLIDKELPEDSSDEEYNPENEDEQSEDEEKVDISMASDADSMPATPASAPAPPTPTQDWSQDELFKIPQENVGQRTRSKLNFNALPLESLEQAFVPPDVTHDMYEAVCDNPDWNEFLKEFTQPLQLNETLDDDPDNDPEYNILEDEGEGKIEDKEEMRKDRAVKVSKRELNSLMSELFDYTEDLSSDEDNAAQTHENIAELEKSIMKETEDRQKREELERERKKKKKQKRGFLPTQLSLLQQQLQQHVQLTTQHFLQTYEHPRYHCYADTCRTMLITLSGLKRDNICRQEIYNLDPAINTITEWEGILAEPEAGVKIKEFVKEQLDSEKVKKRKKKNAETSFPKELMCLLAHSEVVLYPKMLPPLPFRTTLRRTGPNAFTPSEDMLLAICLEQVLQRMSRFKSRLKKAKLTLVDMSELLMMICMPRSTARCIAAHIRQLKCRQQNNPIKYFYESGKLPTIFHVVPYVEPGVQLFQQPRHLLPDIWRRYITNDFQKRNLSLKLTCTALKDKVSSVTSTANLSKDEGKATQSIPNKINIPLFNGHLPSLQNKETQDNKISFSPNKILTDKTNEKTCHTEQKKNRDVLWREKNVITCKIKGFTKALRENKGSFKDNVLNEIADNSSNVIKIRKAKSLQLKETECASKVKITHSNNALNELTNNEIRTVVNKSDLPMKSSNCKHKKTNVLKNSCNGELETSSEISTSYKSTEKSDSLKSKHFHKNNANSKLPFDTVSHKPRPPSTVKLKDT